MSDRKRAIETLKQLRLDYEEFYEEHNNEVTQAYDMAISSLETDEAYQLEYESTTKNDLVVDCISRKAVINQIFYSTDNNGDVVLGSALRERITRLPSVTPQEPKSEWEHDHEILKAYSDGADEVLDKIRAEIDNALSDGMIHKKTVLGIIDKYKTEIEPQESKEQTDGKE